MLKKSTLLIAHLIPHGGLSPEENTVTSKAGEGRGRMYIDCEQVLLADDITAAGIALHIDTIHGVACICLQADVSTCVCLLHLIAITRFAYMNIGRIDARPTIHRH